MGLYNRDYYRELPSSDGIFGGTPVVKYLILANIVVFLLQIFLVRPPRVPDLEAASKLTANQDQPLTQRQIYELMRDTQPVSIVQEWFELDTSKVVESGQVWRLLTSTFCHDRHSVFHILFNMLFLYWFGRTLEQMYGSREFLLFYLAGGVCASLAFVGLDLYTGSPVPAIGASGAVMAVLMLYTMHFPCETICVCWFFPLQMRWLMVLFVIWDLHPILLALSGDHLFTGVAHAAHLGGLAFGFLYAWYEWRLEPALERILWLRWRATPRIHRPPAHSTYRDSEPGPDAQRLDQVLEKIYRSGQDSLTEEERNILRASSEQLKTRARGR